jgi:23S rRNA pseudouridine1911/1915/1917 synthase
MKIQIIFENKNILVINKPSGLIVHSDGKTKNKTLVDWILKKYPEIENIGEKQSSNSNFLRPGIVHRLDAQTSGILIIAKNQKTFLNLKQQFKNREIEKIYYAFVFGKFKQEHGVINTPIGKNPNDFRKFLANPKARGTLRPSITKYQVLINDEISYLKIIPKTGRTHQIRVHLKSINHPVICDPLYSTKTELKKIMNKENILNFQRLALHAYSIKLKISQTQIEKFISPFPQDFTNSLEILKKINNTQI